MATPGPLETPGQSQEESEGSTSKRIWEDECGRSEKCMCVCVWVGIEKKSEVESLSFQTVVTDLQKPFAHTFLS